MFSGSFKNDTYKQFVYKWYISNICIKQDLALNNPQGFICRKTQHINKPTNELSFFGYVKYL